MSIIKRLKFEHWAMRVRSRPWAATTVLLHRFQRITVHGPKVLHGSFANAEHRAWNRAILGPDVFN